MRDERTVNASPEQIWSLLSDVDEWDTMLPTVDTIERVGPPGPTKIGDRFRVHNVGLPEAVYEVTAWDPDHEFTWVADAPGIRTTAYHRLTPIEGGTRMTLGIEWSGPLAWLVRPLLGTKVRRMVTQEADAFTRLAQDSAGMPADRHDE